MLSGIKGATSLVRFPLVSLATSCAWHCAHLCPATLTISVIKGNLAQDGNFFFNFLSTLFLRMRGGAYVFHIIFSKLCMSIYRVKCCDLWQPPPHCIPPTHTPLLHHPLPCSSLSRLSTLALLKCDVKMRGEVLTSTKVILYSIYCADTVRALRSHLKRVTPSIID